MGLVVGADRFEERRRALLSTTREQLPRLMFVLMPVFGLMLGLAYRSRRLRLPVHLVMSLHLHAFGFTALPIGAAFAAVRQYYVRAPALVALMAWGLLYVVLALRRVYGGRVWLAGVRAVLLLGSYFFVGLVTVMTIVTLYIYLS